MSFGDLFVKSLRSRRSRAVRHAPRSQHRRRLVLETLEARLALTTFTVAAGDVSNVGDSSTDTGGLVWAVNQANATGGTNTISLASGSTYDFTTADNYWYGPNSLPAVSSSIVIQGNGATLERDSSLGQTTADAFRFFYVSGGLSGLAAGDLTLNNLTLENGLAKGGDSDGGGGGLGAGGAIFNQGNLTLDTVTLADNEALGGSSGVTTAGNGGGGMGQDAPADGDGGGFGGVFPGPVGGGGGAGGNVPGGGGGGGFSASGAAATNSGGGSGGGLSGLGGDGGYWELVPEPIQGGAAGDGGGGGGGAGPGGDGGAFGFGGEIEAVVNSGSGGGGGIGGGGAVGGNAGGGGGFGGGGGSIQFIVGNGFKAAQGGFGAGAGSLGGAGTAGDGMGGAVFSMYGTARIVNSSLTDNTAVGGSNSAGTAGSGYGGGFFNLDGVVTFIGGAIDATNLALNGTGASQGLASNGSDAYANYAFGNNPDGSTGQATLFLDGNSKIPGNGAGFGAGAQIVPISSDQLGAAIYPAPNGPPLSGQVVFDVVFSQPVTGFSLAGVVLGGTAPGATAAVTGSGANYTVTVSGMMASGTVTASVAAGAAQNADGDQNQASLQAGAQFFDFNQQGNTVTVVGTSGNDSFSVDVVPLTTPPSGTGATEELVVTLNGFSQTYEASPQQPITINYDGYGADVAAGGDTSVVFGTLGASQASFSPAAAQVSGIAYSINVANSATNYVYGNGSTALFTGESNLQQAQGLPPNCFVGTPSYSYMSGEYAYRAPPPPPGTAVPFSVLVPIVPYENFAVGFGTVYAYANSSADTATLYSSHGAVVAMTPAYSYVSAGGATTFADGFSSVYAYSAGDGSDSAFQYDSATIATGAPGVTLTESASGVSFVATPALGYMSGQFSSGNVPNFFNVASGFSSVLAIAQGSGDIAYLDESGQSGDVLLAFADGAAGIRDASHEALVQGFPLIYASGGSGTNELDVEGNTNDAPNLPGASISPVSYEDGNELVQTGFDSASLVLEGADVNAVDFVFRQFADWTG